MTITSKLHLLMIRNGEKKDYRANSSHDLNMKPVHVIVCVCVTQGAGKCWDCHK